MTTLRQTEQRLRAAEHLNELRADELVAQIRQCRARNAEYEAEKVRVRFRVRVIGLGLGL